jgi:hypothetical protein
MDALPALLLGVLLPACVAGVVMLALYRRSGAVAAALAVGAGAAAGHVALRGWSGWPPREAMAWLPVVAVLGAVTGALGVTRRGPAPLRSLLRLGLAAAVVWLLLGKVLTRQTGDSGPLRAVALLAAGLAVGWSAFESLATPRVRRGPLLLLVLLATGSAVVLGLSGSVVLAQLAGALTAAVGAVLVLPVRAPGADLLRGAAPPAMLLLGSQLLLGFRLADVPADALLLLAAAPVAALAVRAIAGRRAHASGGEADNPRTLAAQLVVVGLLLGLAVARAVAASPPLDY